MITMETNAILRKVTYSLIVLFIPILFYKMAKHPDKGYGLFMIFILLGSFFTGAVFKIFSLFGVATHIIPEIPIAINKFSVLWMVCLAIYHYSILKAFKGKFRIFPYKTFISYAVFFSILIASLTNAKILRSWAGDSYFVNVVALSVLIFIACKARSFKNDLHMLPFSIHESAAKLYRFAAIMSCFPLNDIALEVSVFKASCPGSQGIECVFLDLYSLIIYQSWVWYAVYFNWKTLMNVTAEPADEEDGPTCPSTSQRSFLAEANA